MDKQLNMLLKNNKPEEITLYLEESFKAYAVSESFQEMTDEAKDNILCTFLELNKFFIELGLVG